MDNKLNLIDEIIINNAINNNILSHAYLLYADKGIDLQINLLNIVKKIYFKFTNKNLDATNLKDIKIEDFALIDNDENQIKKENIDQAIEYLSSTTQKATPKFLIIKNIERGNKFSLNRLLKFIEEPTNENFFIILSSNEINKVIPTVKSRCQNIFIKRLTLNQKKAILNNSFPLLNKEINNIVSFLPSIYNLNELVIKKLNEDFLNLNLFLEKGLDNFSLLALELDKTINEKNIDFILNFLFSFYFNLIESTTNNIFSSNLIKKYKQFFPNKSEIEKIINLIVETKKNLQIINASFNMNKFSFILELGTFYEK